MKRIVSLAYLLILLCALPALAAKDTLVVANGADARSLDPHATTDVPSCHVMVQIYETLTKQENGKIVPYLAEKIEQLDEKTYKFTLRKGVKFHNGEELKASDVAFTFKRAHEVGQIVAMIVGKIDPKGIEVVDDYTIILRTVTPDTSFLAALSHYGGGCILNEKAVKEAGADFGTHPIGTAPFKFVDWKKGDRITLKRFDDYWGEKAGVENLVIRAITESTNRTIELETGDVDLAYQVLPIDISRIESNPKLTLYRIVDTLLGYVGFNTSLKPFDDVRVRQAITLALNRPAMVKAVFRGTGSPAKGVIPPVILYYDDSLPEPVYDVEKAKSLLAEAGYKDGFKTDIWLNERKERVDIATIMQSQLKKIGIDLSIHVLEWGAFWEKIKEKNYGMYIGGWVTAIPDPDYSVFGMFHSSEADNGLNWSRLKDAKTDELIMAGRSTPNGEERAKIYRELQHHLLDVANLICIYNGEQLTGARKNVKNFVPDPSGYHNLHKVSLAE